MLKRTVGTMLVGLCTAGGARAQVVSATIDTGARGAPIQPYVYGMFVEHIGGLIENGFGAQLLDDRKFYFPVTSTVAPPPAAGQRRRQLLRRWLPIGPEGSVRMDSAHAYAADHAPSIAVTGNEPRGIQQSGLALREGKSYVGRIVLAADPGVAVSVTLVRGPGSRQTVALAGLGTEYATRSFTFAPGESTDSGRIEITGTGSGSFRIGAVSLMPADNLEGFRREVIEALAQLRSGVYRFPGGNFVSAYDWRDAIGDPDRRPPRLDPVWNTLQPNDIGMDEFMTLCRLLHVEPYVTVNAGFGDDHSAAEQVEYMNGAANTPMGRLRAANGHPEPYHVKFWGIGNEPWGIWQMGYMPFDQFVVKHRLFARAMRRVDPTIKLIGAGQMPDGMTNSGEAKRLTGKTVAEYLGPADFSGTLLSHVLDDMDLISEHFYVYNDTHYDLAQGKQVPNDPAEPYIEWARRAPNMVRAKYEHYQEYLKRIPALQKKPVPISLDEWAYSGAGPGTYKAVPALAWALQEMFRHSDLYYMGGFTFAGSTLSASRTEAVLNPTGLMFKLYRDHFGTTPVAVTGTSPQPAPKFPVGGEQPRVNAGSDTYPLDVTAALSADGRALSVAVVNPTESAQPLRLRVQGARLGRAGRVWRLAPGRLDAANQAGGKPEVVVEEAAANAGEALPVPPLSVGVYVFPLR